MIRGMGQQFRFKLPYNSQYNFNDTSEITIVFWQENNSNGPVEKHKEQCAISEHGTYFYVTLSEEDSLQFLDDRKAYVQMRAKTSDGIPFGTKKRPFTVYPIHEGLLSKEEV